MTREDIIRMARGAGICTWEVVPEHEARKLEHFAGSVCILNAELKSVVEELRSSLIELLKEYHPTERWTEKQSERGGTMTREEIIAMAREHHVNSEYTEFGWQEISRYEFNLNELEAFVALIAAAEREACALEADAWQTGIYDPKYNCDVATAVRARGKR